ncbi:MAG: mechanosensitive ion channel family protein [Deltaproteobacteria bacterium]|nr:mechanosensitive ion channel family protein [Deltaproteobacteria bacterium]MBW2307746.1 mechanosensitive ion channel family protein [Deltaproteobacteria bacterium]
MRISDVFRFYAWFFLGWLVLTVAGLNGSSAFGAASSAVREPTALAVQPAQTMNRSDLEELLKTLEDPTQRERLITQIRALLEIQDQRITTAVEPPGTPSSTETWISSEYEQLSHWASELSGQLLEHLKAFPGLAFQLKTYFANRENLVSLGKAGLLIFLILLLALWLRARLLRRLKSIIGRIRFTEEPTWSDKARHLAAEWGIEVIYLLVLLIIILSVSGLIGWESKFVLLLIFLLGTSSLYWLALSFIRKLASPMDPLYRLLPCGDQLAQYFVIWARRLLLYGIFAYAPLWIMEWAGWKEDVLRPLHIVYRFGWIALIWLLLFQWKDRVARIIPRVKEGRTPYTNLMVKNLNWVLGKIYPMAVLFLVIILSIEAMGYADKASFLLWRTGVSLLIVGFGVGIWVIFSFLLGRLFAIGDRIKTRFPGLDVMANRYINFLHFSIKAVLTFFVVVLVLQVWGFELLAVITKGMTAKLLGRLLVVALTVAISFFIIQVTQIIVARLLADRTDDQGQVISMGRRGKTFIPLLNNLVRYITFFIAGVIILEQLGVNTGPVLAGAGIVGLAVGFGAQTLVKDILTGCFIILEDSISVGDVVVVKGTGGLVEAVNLRTIKLRDLAGNVHVIPNSQIEMITNMTKEYSRYVLDVGVAYREDVDEVIQVLKEIDEELRRDPAYEQDILQPLEILGVEEFGSSQVTIRTRITTKPIKQWNVGREMRRRIKKRFDELGIEIPFPHMTLYIGDPKHEPPQPLTIRLQGDTKGTTDKGDLVGENQS